MKKWLSLTLASLLILSLAACGGNGAPSPTPSGSGSVEEDLTEYQAEGVGVFYLPEGFDLDFGPAEVNGMPITCATLTKGALTVEASRFGADAYAAAGAPLPADLEDYAQREGVKAGLPEGTEFSEDEYGSIYAQYTLEDGTRVYHVLKQGTDAFGAVTVSGPEDAFDGADAALWAGKAELE